MAPVSDPPSDGPLRQLTNPRLVAFAACIGIGGGVVAIVYYYLLHYAMHGAWEKLAHLSPTSLPLEPNWMPVVLVITTLGGLLVGLLTRWLGSAGEIAAVVDNIHLRDGRIDMRQTPSMAATSLVSITAGGSAGPEAPLVQIIGSLASRLGDALRVDGRVVRTFTFCGMGAALGAFFGAPLGGALFALEIPHRRGIEYYEALLPALVASIAAFLCFRAVVGYEPVLFHFVAGHAASDEPMRLTHVLWAFLFGTIGAGAAVTFAILFNLCKKLAHPLHNSPVLLGTLGGVAIGLCAQLAPMSLFWGEYQIDNILAARSTILQHHTLWGAVGLLMLLAVVKSLAIGATLHSGFRGGFIFPLLFIGAAVGCAISLLLPGVPAPVVILATMAAVNVAVTKTPISTCVILGTLAGASLMPVLITASLTSLLLTTRLSLIHTQRTRHPQPAHA